VNTEREQPVAAERTLLAGGTLEATDCWLIESDTSPHRIKEPLVIQ